VVSAAFGEIGHYVEPFAGGLGVLLARAPVAAETVNDADGLLVNAWRAIQRHPIEVSERICGMSLSEPDLHACHASLVEWRADEEGMSRLCGDVGWCDVEMAARWLHGSGSNRKERAADRSSGDGNPLYH